MFSRVLVLFLFLTSTCTTTQYLSGDVVRVADGDTFTMLVEGQQQRIRLHGIDCPEKGQPYSRVATQFTKDMLALGKVKVQQLDTDRYGRVIGIVLVNDTVNLNERLLAAGLAWHYKTYDPSPEWARMEKIAQTAKHGLWVEKDAVAPWEWRKRKRAERSK